MMRMLWLAVMTAVFVLGAVIAYYNTTPVALDYLGGTSQRPLIFWLLLSFVLGFAAAWLGFVIRGLKLRIELRHLRGRRGGTEPRRKTADAPPTASSAAEINPPVDDSAIPTVSPRAFRRAPIFSDRGNRSCMVHTPFSTID